MTRRVMVHIPQPLYDRLRRRTEETGASMCSLIVKALEQVYEKPRKGRYVTGPLVASGKRGPAFPTDENPHDIVFS